MGRDVAEAFGLSDPSPIATVREWGVRQLGKELAIRTHAGLEKKVVGGLLPRLRRRRRPARGARARHPARRAEVDEDAALARRPPRVAHPPSVPDQQVREPAPVLVAARG